MTGAPTGYARVVRFQIWELRHADGGAEGTPFARARIAPADEVWVHAAPDRLRVEILDDGDALVASAEGLEAVTPTPLCRLRREGPRVLREDAWPTEADLGAVVILPGGEAGRLASWRTDDDRTRWRWSLEFEGGS